MTRPVGRRNRKPRLGTPKKCNSAKRGYMHHGIFPELVAVVMMENIVRLVRKRATLMIRRRGLPVASSVS